LVQQRGVALGMAFLDGTNIRAHQKAAGADKRGADSEQRDRREALGRSRGGYGTKACVMADGRGRAVAFALAPGQAHELPMGPGLLDCLPDVPGWVVGDRGLASAVSGISCLGRAVDPVQAMARVKRSPKRMAN
jgi:hypothetical protein